jgi:hypothetical protein
VSLLGVATPQHVDSKSLLQQRPAQPALDFCAFLSQSILQIERTISDMRSGIRELCTANTDDAATLLECDDILTDLQENLLETCCDAGSKEVGKARQDSLQHAHGRLACALCHVCVVYLGLRQCATPCVHTSLCVS